MIYAKLIRRSIFVLYSLIITLPILIAANNEKREVKEKEETVVVKPHLPEPPYGK